MQMLWGEEYRTGRDYDVVTKTAKPSPGLALLGPRAAQLLTYFLSQWGGQLEVSPRMDG